MFGLMRPCKGVDDADLELWRKHMCSGCYALRDSFGQLSRATLSTDSVFLSVLLEGAGGSFESGSKPQYCPFRTFELRSTIRSTSPALVALAALNVRLASVVADDRLRDGGVPTLLRRPAFSLLARMDRRVREGEARVGLNSHAFEDLLDEFHRSEERGEPRTIELVGSAYQLIYTSMAELAETKLPPQQLGQVGRSLGRLTFINDAVRDLATDFRNGSPNPLLALTAENATRIGEELLDTERSKLLMLLASLPLPQLHRSLLLRLANRAGAHQQCSAQRERHDKLPNQSGIVARAATVFALSRMSSACDDACCPSCDDCCEGCCP